VTSGNRGGRATRLALVSVAERLFAERGIDAVSISEILDAAGQRNKNAIHYHFGGKDGLITAIAEHRSAALNARRDELLDDILRRGVEHDITAVSRTLVVPLAELLDVDDCHFVGFLARYHLDRSRRQLVESVDPQVTATYRTAYQLLRRASGLSTRAFEIRFGIAMDLIFTALATRQAAELSGDPPRAPRSAFIEELVQCVAGCFRHGE
jgi:AcrR family transcriptional regulator